MGSNIVRLPQDFAVNRFADSIREAQQSIGEMCILIAMYHSAVDDGINNPLAPHCPRCWDDTYESETDTECPVCYGSGFNGYKQYGRIWSIFSDNTDNNELRKKYGEWEGDDREVQIENIIDFHEHDYLVRVKKFNNDYTINTLGPRYRVDNPTPVSLRTGARFGQQSVDYAANKTKAHMLRGFSPIQNFVFPPGPIPRFVSVGD